MARIKLSKKKYEKSKNSISNDVFAVNLETGKVLRFNSLAEAGRQLGILAQNIGAVINGKQNTAGGYWFTEDESEITEEKIQEIRANMNSLCGIIAINIETSEVLWFKSQSEAGRQLNIDARNVNGVVKSKRHKAKGFWFCYADENAVEKARKKFDDEIAKKVEELLNKNQN